MTSTWLGVKSNLMVRHSKVGYGRMKLPHSLYITLVERAKAWRARSSLGETTIKTNLQVMGVTGPETLLGQATGVLVVAWSRGSRFRSRSIDTKTEYQCDVDRMA